MKVTKEPVVIVQPPTEYLIRLEEDEAIQLAHLAGCWDNQLPCSQGQKPKVFANKLVQSLITAGVKL